MTEDGEIIALYWERDERAIRETEHKYGRLCHSISYGILHSESDTEECVNDTYLCLWNTIPPERPLDFVAYICRIVRNISFKRRTYNRAEKRSAFAVVSLSDLDELLPDSDTWDIADEELGRMINDFLSTEKKANRMVFVRHYFFGEELTAIAARYGYSENKVKSTLFRMRGRLKKYLHERGIGL